MAEKNILYTVTGKDTPPTTIVPLYRSNHGAKMLSIRAEIWVPGFPIIPFPLLDLDLTQDEQNAILLKNEFDNAQIFIYLYIRDLVKWHLIRFFSIVSRGAQQSPDILLPFRNPFGYFSLQKGYSLGVFFEFPQRSLEDYEHISIFGDIEESVIDPTKEVVDDSPIPVPAPGSLIFPGSTTPPTPPPEPISIFLELETGATSSPMEVVLDPLASGGAFVLIPEGAGVAGSTQVFFQIPSALDYAIWGRVKAPDPRADSFFVQLDDLTAFQWNLSVSTEWSWQRIKTLDNQKMFPLIEGLHTIKVLTREDGAAIDVLYITSDLSDSINISDS